ncbi:hypothetical protein EMCRGX_G008283 [Ephydatia muelleri]
MQVYCDGNECTKGLLPRPKATRPPLLEEENRPSIAPSNAIADITPTLHESTAEVCAVVAHAQVKGGGVQCVGRWERQPPPNESDAVRRLMKIASRYRDSDGDGTDEMQRGE